MELEGKRVLVTGGAGFIGSNLVHRLLDGGAALVQVVDDFSNADFANLRGADHRLGVHAADLNEFDFTELEDAPEVIYHLAAITDTTVEDQQRMLRANLRATRRVIRLAKEVECGLIYASSAAVYGQREERMSEDDEPEPANIYGFSKACCDRLAKRVRDRDELPFLAGMRFFNVYGPGESHKGKFASMILQLAQQMRDGGPPRIFEYGEQQRDFVYIEDVLDGLVAAAEHEADGVFNLGTGSPRSFNELVETLNNALGTDQDPEYFENPFEFYQAFTCADLTRSKEELDYTPEWDLSEGVLDYMRRLGWSAGPGEEMTYPAG